MTIYDWNLVQVHIKNVGEFQDVIHGFTAHIACKDSEDNRGYSSQIKVPVDTTDLTNFKTLDTLTKKDVVAWVEASVSSEDVDRLKAEAYADAHFYATTSVNMPWGEKIK